MAKTPAKKATTKKAAVAAPAAKDTPSKALTTAAAHDYGEDQGGGFDALSGSDYAVPFVGILQKGSPQLDPSDPKYIDGAKVGQIFNTVTNDRVTALEVIPAHPSHQYVEWTPRDSGGGFVGTYAINDPVVERSLRSAKRRTGKLKVGGDEEGNDLVETYYLFCLARPAGDEGELADGDWQQVVIAFTSTQIKKFKGWMTRARALLVQTPSGGKVNPPLWAHIYRLTTVPEKNQKGSWFGWNVAFATEDAADCRLTPMSDDYMLAKNFRDAVQSGVAKAATEGLTSEVTDAEIITDDDNM